MLVYPAAFEKGSKYIIVKFPDIPEAMTQAQTIEEAYEMANEVLGAVLEDYEDFPKASSIEVIQKQFPDKEVALISIDLVEYHRKYHSKTIHKNIATPE